MTDLDLQPLQELLPTRSAEECRSIAACEGVVVPLAHERSTLLSSAWFRSSNAGYRALLVAAMTEWTTRGSNQRRHRIDPASPLAAGAVAAAAIKAAQNRSAQ